MTGNPRPEDSTTHHNGRYGGATLAARLDPTQRELAELEDEYLLLARAGNVPVSWNTWADLNAELMAVRAAQGRDARDAGYWPLTSVITRP